MRNPHVHVTLHVTVHVMTVTSQQLPTQVSVTGRSHMVVILDMFLNNNPRS